MHRDLLVSKSEFFRAALEGPWIEGETGNVTLKDTEIPEFEVFVHWLYCNAIERPRSLEASWRINDWAMLVNLWCTGDALMSIPFKNAIMDVMVK